MAKVRVKSNLVIEAVSKEIKAEASADDYNNELESMAKMYGMSVDDIKNALGEDNEYVKDSIVGRKTVEYIAEKAVKTEPKEEKEEKPAKKTAAKKTTAKKTTSKKAAAKEEAPAEAESEAKEETKDEQ